MVAKRIVFFGESPLQLEEKKTEGSMVKLEGEKFYRISHFDQMPPFFLTVVSDSDHWMFLSSRGGLTCGRRAPENALFPYYTDDKIHDASSATGPVSILLIEKEGRQYLWEPFKQGCPEVYHTEKNLYKSTAGNKVIYEAVNLTLQLSYSCSWMNSERFGFVKESSLVNLGSVAVDIKVVDGIRNILPYGVNSAMQSNMSTLVDGYKRCELHETSGMAMYSLSSIPTDRAEPSEALKATVAWATGRSHPKYLLSEDQLERFREGIVPETELEKRGKRGAYLVYDEFLLDPGMRKVGMVVADVNQGPSEIAGLLRTIQDNNLIREIRDDVKKGTRRDSPTDYSIPEMN